MGSLKGGPLQGGATSSAGKNHPSFLRPRYHVRRAPGEDRGRGISATTFILTDTWAVRSLGRPQMGVRGVGRGESVLSETPAPRDVFGSDEL